jgi:hypothetical protein
VRLRVAVCLTLTGLLAGCAQPRPAPAPVAPNPFGYMKRSAVCTTSPIRAQDRAVEMKTRSDDGLCGIAISQPEGDAYASFVLATLPVHGDSFIYNYNRQTYVTYTAKTAYAGPDAFTVSLIPGGGRPRTSLAVSVSVDNAGVVLPPPPVAAKAAPKTTTHRKRRKPQQQPQQR